MADPNSQSQPQTLAAAPTDDSAIQHQAAVTTQQSPQGALGYAVAAPKQGATMVAPASPQGAPGFAVVPQGAENVAAPASPQGPPGFWVAPEQLAPAPPQGAPVMAPPQGAMMAPQQQHFATETVSGSQQGMQMLVQAEAMAMGMMMPSMPLQAQTQAQAMVAHTLAQGMAPSQSLPVCHASMMEMQQAQAGYIMAPPPLPLGPPPAMLQQQPPQGAMVMIAQQPLPFSPPSVMLQHNPRGNQVMMTQPQFTALPCKRQRLDQYGL